MILFKDILTFLGLVYRDASLIMLYLVVTEISYKKSEELDNFNIQKFVVKKVKNRHVSNGRTDILVLIIELLRFLNCI